MKKKFGLFALVLTVLLCGSLFLFAACGDGEEEEPSATPAISVTVNETARQSGATIEGDTEDTYTIAASVVNGEEGASVTISYVYESGEAEDFSGSTFSPREAGTYVFTFTAEGASNFTLTFEIAEAQAPAHEHTYGTWNVTAPTETNAGQAVRTCSECAEGTEGKTQTVTLPALGSDEAKTAYTSKVTTPATCTVKEVVTYTYTAEGFSFTVTGEVSYEQSAHGTSLSFFDAKAATCTEAGEIAYAHCTACGKYYKVDGNTIGEEILEGEDGLTDPSRPATGHSYAWSIKEGDEPFIGKTGTATGICSCGNTTTRELPAMTDDNANQEVTTPTVGKYSFHFTQQGTCTQPTIAEITYKFEDGVTVTFTLEQPPFGHSYSKVEAEYDAATMNATWSAKVYCDRGCGIFEEVENIPAVDITDDGAWVRDEGGNYTAPTCGEDGSGTYYYSGLELSDGTPIKVFVTNVPIPATGDHSYGKPEYSDNTVTVICEVCETASVSAKVTIVGDGATGTTEFGSDAFSFADGTFTVTLPQNAFEKEGFSFSGWLVGEETKQAGDSATVAENGTLVITAQWTEVTTPTISARADKTEIYAGEQITLTWSLTGGEGEVTVTYTKDDVPADTLKPVSGEAFAINEVGVYKFTFTAVDAEAVTVTVTVKENVITLSVTLGGELVDGVENDGSATVCIGTEIGYIATVTGGGSVTGVYIFEDGNATDLTSAEGTFTFENIGTYRFTFSANGATSYVYTVEVVAHDYTGQPYISAGEEGHYQVCKNCGVAHSETVAHVLQAENNNTQHWQGCAVCDYETAKSDHVLTWQSDDTQHWQACSGCAYTTAKENHSYAIAYADGTVDYVCECGKVSASATVTITVTGGTGVVAAEAFSWTGEEFEIDLSQVEISELAADVKVVYYRIADELIVTDESYAFAESVAIEAVLEDTQATIGGTGVHWNETAWSSVLKKGDAMTVAGQLDSTAAFNWQGVFVQVYSTENVVGAFRLDNYINGEEGPEDNAAYSTGENFILTKDGTYTDFNEKGTFINLIKDCTLRITIDWTNPALIEITLNLTGKVDGVNKVQTVCYTIAAKPDTSLKDSYTIGLGYEEATYAISSVERCDGQHGDAELFCSVCNELNKTALDAAATETAAWDNGVTLGADAFVMKATITGNDAYGVFYELITQVDGDFVTAEAPKGYVDVHASNVQDTGTYFNAWGGGNNGFDSTADKMIVQHGTRPVGADAWSGGVYTIYAFRDTQGSGMLYVEYTKDGSTYGAGVYLQNWAANVSVRFTAVGVMTEGASVTVLTGAYPAA